MVEGSALATCLAAIQSRCITAEVEAEDRTVCDTLLTEIHALAECINATRQDLAALDANDIVVRHVPAATEQLDAIVTHTATATGTILDACEQLERELAFSSCHGAVSLATRRIYEACSFQDITGQRVAKVVQTLLTMESRVQAILRVFGTPAHAASADLAPRSLLSGPQRPQDAMDQGAVDALLADFE